MPHNNTQQASQEATYMKPEEVDFTKPLKLSICGTIYTYDPVTTLTCNTESGWQDHCNFIVGDIMAGRAKVFAEPKQPESKQDELFGRTFRFLSGSDTTESTYHSSTEGNPKITWMDDYGDEEFSFDFTEWQARKYIAEGSWTILPTASQAPQQIAGTLDEESFTYAERTIKASLFPPKQHSLHDHVHEFNKQHGKCSLSSSGVWHNRRDYTFEFTVHSEGKLKKLIVAMNSVEA